MFKWFYTVADHMVEFEAQRATHCLPPDLRATHFLCPAARLLPFFCCGHFYVVPLVVISPFLFFALTPFGTNPFWAYKLYDFCIILA